MDRTELAWAAGFWDGEGSAYLSRGERRSTAQPHARVNQSGSTGTPEVLTRFAKAVGYGEVLGPDLIDGRAPLYRWEVANRPDVQRLLAALSPWLGTVKRKQMSAVLDIDPPMAISWQQWSYDEQCAWAAGLWDGEGCVCLLKHRSHSGHFVPEAALTQSSWEGRPEVLDRLAAVAEGGYWYGPYDQEGSNLQVYRWKLFRTPEIRAFLDRVWPWIGAVKRTQAEKVFAVLGSQPVLSRGNPRWGNRKTHCIRGHDYETARVRPFRGRGKNVEAPRASHQCLQCVREDARVRRIRRKMASGG